MNRLRARGLDSVHRRGSGPKQRSESTLPPLHLCLARSLTLTYLVRRLQNPLIMLQNGLPEDAFGASNGQSWPFCALFWGSAYNCPSDVRLTTASRRLGLG
jgi:hypothetical protein